MERVIDIDGVLKVVSEQAIQIAMLSGEIEHLKKHSEKQAAELSELRKNHGEHAQAAD